ncbi:MAG: TVP38/TMEM64 family protein [Desulfuromonadales bacterium]|nr:TVP38/TMEM64 family protein [Desulfuromonadales bacterium]
MNQRASRLLLITAIAVLTITFFAFDLQKVLTLAEFKARQQEFAAFYASHRLQTLVLYFLCYVVVTALSLPGAAVMTLAGGALLGFWAAFVTVALASTLGATLAFLSSRFLLRDWVQEKFGDKLKAVNEGVAQDGAFYLLTLRLVPIFPFFIINLVMGLTPMPTRTFAWVSQIGMLPATAVFVNAGTQLARIESAAGILSPQLLLSFALLGLFPLIAKRIVTIIRRRK